MQFHTELVLPIYQQTITSHLNWTHRTQTYDVWSAFPGLGQAHKCGGVKPVNGSQPSLLITDVNNGTQWWRDDELLYTIMRDENNPLCSGFEGSKNMFVLKCDHDNRQFMLIIPPMQFHTELVIQNGHVPQ
jgi:hypothetical protein